MSVIRSIRRHAVKSWTTSGGSPCPDEGGPMFTADTYGLARRLGVLPDR
jgi:hypothetical protein